GAVAQPALEDLGGAGELAHVAEVEGDGGAGGRRVEADVGGALLGEVGERAARVLDLEEGRQPLPEAPAQGRVVVVEVDDVGGDDVGHEVAPDPGEARAGREGLPLRAD